MILYLGGEPAWPGSADQNYRQDAEENNLKDHFTILQVISFDLPRHIHSHSA